jgi:hypothetical protein
LKDYNKTSLKVCEHHKIRFFTKKKCMSPEPAVFTALGRNITGFQTCLSRFLGDQSIVCFFSLLAKPGLNVPPFDRVHMTTFSGAAAVGMVHKC